MTTKRAAMTLLLGAALGCGGGSQVKPGPMPAGASFYGVWQSPQYGNMHLCQSGRQIVGDYLKHERSGRIQGEIDGDVMRFQWEDTRELVQGKPMERRGHGYFRLELGDDGDQYLQGEWGFDGEDQGGGPWNAVKLRRGDPDRCSGRGQVEETEDITASWDEDEPSAGEK